MQRPKDRDLGPRRRALILVLLASPHLDATRLGLLCLWQRQHDNAIAHLSFDLVLINLVRNPKTPPEWTDIVFAIDRLQARFAWPSALRPGSDPDDPFLQVRVR